MEKNINDIKRQVYKILSQCDAKQSKDILKEVSSSLKNGQPLINKTQTECI